MTETDSRPFALRMLILYLFVAAAVVGMYSGLSLQQRSAHRSEQRFEREIIANCVQVNKANTAFNGVLDQQIRNVKNSTAITPAQRAQAIAVYGQLHLPISVCPR